MFTSDIKVKIDFDIRPESKDPEKLSTAIFVLQNVREAFEKAGTCCKMEVDILKDAEKILDKVDRGEVF